MDVVHSDLQFPLVFTQPFATDFFNIIKSVDRYLGGLYLDNQLSIEDRTMIIYGGVAVMLWLGGVTPLHRDATRDLDLVGTRGFYDSTPLFADFQASFLIAAAGLLDEVQFSGGQFFKPPDYMVNLVDLSGRLDLNFLKVMVLHPFDLMLSKFARYADKDYEDISALFEFFVIDERRDEFFDYFYISYPYASDSEQRNFRDGLLDVTGVEFDESKVNHDPSNL